MHAHTLRLYATILTVAIVLTALEGVPPALATGKLQPGRPAIVVGTEGHGLRVRAGPGMMHPIVTKLGEGTTDRIVSGPVRVDNDDWYQIGVGASTSGWSVGRYLVPSKPSQKAPDVKGRRTFSARVTAYADGIGGVPRGARTFSGTRTRWGVVAVDPTVIPLGSSLLIEGFDGTTFIAEDTGAGIKGETIDLWMPDARAAQSFGVQYRRVTIVRERPAR